MRRGLLPLLLLVSALGLGAPRAAGAQESADSVRSRVRQTLERLARPPLPDSLRMLPDSAVRSPGRSARRAPGRGSQADGDSIAQALSELPGYTVSQYEGARAEFGAQSRRLILYGAEGSQARFIGEGVQLAADSSITYDERARRIFTRGSSAFTPQGGDEVQSDSLVYDLGLDRGTALGARTRYTEGANWIVTGDLPSVSRDVAWGSHTRFTSCDLEIPHYHFETGEIKIVGGKVLVARPVTLYFADVPVAWLPFIAQSLGSGRSSGLLTPRFSVNDIVRTSRGYSRRVSNVGFYWAMSDYTDATFAMDWWSDNYVAFTGGLRYNWLRKFLRGSVNYRQFWRAEGGQEIALDSNHDWELSERTRFRVSLRYASSADFIRRNSFDPRELTSTIDSEGGLNRRFDWGSLSLSANRRQSLSNDEVTSNLPQVNLSLSPITFLSAPASTARWFNNITWSGSGNYNRQTVDKAPQPDTAQFSLAQADKINTRGGFTSNLNLGGLSWSQSVNFTQNVTTNGLLLTSGEGVPDLERSDPTGDPGGVPGAGILGVDRTVFGALEDRMDLDEASVDWNMSLGYQQRLIGSTTLTPNLTFSGRSRRSNESPLTSSFVEAPTRLSFGATLKTDLYGFFPGVGSFEAIRHKISPSFQYSYAPEVTQTALQDSVFGPGEIQARNQVTVTLNQTFEAKRRQDETASDTAAAADTASGPRRVRQAEIVKLFALQTSAVTYDLVRADSLGRFSDGFTTTQLTNQVSSDFLRGLSVSLTHDLFEGTGGERRFKPKVTRMNMSFSLNSRSMIFRWLRLTSGDQPEPPENDPDVDLFDPVGGFDESQIVPQERDPFFSGRSQRQPGRSTGGAGGWSSNLSYSLQRGGVGGLTQQMLQGTLNFRPTEHWSVNWRTSYDIEEGVFNDHIISLTRELHRWEATFDFRQTAAGNWSFRFEVALLDNRDLKFDYQQRSDSALRR